MLNIDLALALNYFSKTFVLEIMNNIYQSRLDLIMSQRLYPKVRFIYDATSKVKH